MTSCPDDPASQRFIAPFYPEPEVVLHVNPSHVRDELDSADLCFATLQEAVRHARTLRRKFGKEEAVRIKLAAGRHVMLEPLELDKEDSGIETCPFIIEGDTEIETVISGGRRLDGCRPTTDPAVLERLPVASRGRVWECNLRENGIASEWGKLSLRFGCGKATGPATPPWPEIYYNGTPMSLTRWPSDDYAYTGEVLQGGHTRNDDTYDTPGEFCLAAPADLRRWHKSLESGDVWTVGMWAWLWNCSILPVERVDYATGAVRHGVPAPYGIRKGKPFYFINLLEELRKPGQYFVERSRGMLYFIPIEDGASPEGAAIELTLASRPFVKATNASHVVLRHLAFEYHQADAVVVEGGGGVALEFCRIGKIAGTAVIVRGGEGHRVLHSDLHTLGAGGIYLTAGDRKVLAAGRCLIENCRIHDFARINRAYAPAIRLGGCGNTVRHNEIFQSPHHGLRVAGDNHVVELNAFHHLVLEFDDQSAIDMYGNPYFRGNLFRWNSFHDIGGGQTREGQAGIRLDDFISAAEIYGNVFYRVGRGTMGGIQLHGGKDTKVTNNLFIECQAMVSFSPWGKEKWRERLNGKNRELREAELTPERVKVYPDLLDVESNHDRNFLTNNVALGCETLSLDDAGDNVFANNGVSDTTPDWPLREDGLPAIDFTDPIFQKGAFCPIPVEYIGPYKISGCRRIRI